MTFIDNALLLAKTQGHSQKELARLSNVAPSRLSEWKNNVGSPSLAQAIRIAKVLGVSIDRLLLEDSHKILVAGPESVFEAVTEDERSILDLYRALGLSKQEGMRALAGAGRGESPIPIERRRSDEPRPSSEESRLEFLPADQSKRIEMAPSSREATGSITLLEVEPGDVIRHGLVHFIAIDGTEPLRAQEIQYRSRTGWPKDGLGFRIEGDFEWASREDSQAQKIIASLGLSRQRFRHGRVVLINMKHDCMILWPGCADLYLPGPGLYLCWSTSANDFMPNTSAPQ